MLLGLSETADFEFHISEWITRNRSSPFRTIPEAQRLTVPVLCIRGADEYDSACRTVKGVQITSMEVGCGHHFSGNYAELVNAILEPPNDSLQRSGYPSRTEARCAG